MKAYLQSSNNEYVDDYVYLAYQGFSDFGMECIKFEDINEVPIGKENIVVSFIEDTVKYFKRCGITPPMSLNIPEVLHQKLTRKVYYTTLGDFIKNSKCPAFIKPNGIAKSFPSGVLQNDRSKELLLNGYDANLPAMVSELIGIDSEYRVFICNGKIIGMKHYSGNVFSYPEYDYINSCFQLVNKLENFPVSYSLDFAVLNNGKTEFIEANDAWSIGSYGLDCTVYATFLIKRWNEIFKNFKS